MVRIRRAYCTRFFDDDVSVDTKKKMVNALDVEGPENPLKRITLDASLIKSKQLEDFVSKNTLRFFSITGISSNFIKKMLKIGKKMMIT